MGTMWRKSKQQLNNKRERDFSNTHSARELIMGLQFSIASTHCARHFSLHSAHQEEIAQQLCVSQSRCSRY
jgi:hypothetical protein